MSNEPQALKSSSMQIEPVCWLWPNYVAKGHLSAIEGKPGVGKTALCAHVAAKVTNHDTQPEKVLIVESDNERITPWCQRLNEARANLELVYFFPPDKYPFSALDAAIQKTRPILVIIDPVKCARDLRFLADIANRRQCALLCTTRSLAVSNAARIHIAVTHDASVSFNAGFGPFFRVFVKRSNIGPSVAGPAFDIKNGAANFIK